MKKLFSILIFTFITVVAFNSINAQNFEWAKNVTGPLIGGSISTDVDGNIYVTAMFLGTVDFGNTILTSNNSSLDVFIAKFNSAGNCLWASKSGGPGMERVFSISTDSYGNSFITGLFQESAAFGSTTLTSYGDCDIFIAKYDNQGNCLWARSGGGLMNDFGMGISTDGDGNCYATGWFIDSAIFETTIVNSPNQGPGLFVVKYNSAGDLVWIRGNTGLGTSDGMGIATDQNGNSYVHGMFSGLLNFGTFSLSASDNLDIFVAKYDNAGNCLWAVKGGGENQEWGGGISIENNGNSYIKGTFNGTATFGSITLTASVDNDIFIAKYDDQGNCLWVKNLGISINAGWDGMAGITTDALGNSFITGRFNGTVTVGGTLLTSSGGDEIFIAKYDNSGNFIWVTQAGGIGSDYGNGITTSHDGNIYAIGGFSEDANFGNIVLPDYGMFLTKIGTSLPSNVNLLSPINGITGHTLQPSFTWEDTNFETRYELRISSAGTDQTAFEAGVIFTDLDIVSNTTSITYTENTTDDLNPSLYPFPLTPNTTYYWQMVATDGSNRVLSPIRHFTTYPAVTVNLWNPGYGATIYTTDLLFSYGINGSSNGLKFRLQAKASVAEPVKTDWLTSEFSVVSPNLSQTLNVAGGTKYFWRVVLLNDQNEIMAYSETRDFTTVGGASRPIPSWPVGGAVLYSYTPMLYWYMNGFGTDLTYDIEINTDTLLAAIHSAGNLTSSSYQLPITLTPGTNYFWKVRSVYKRGTGQEQISEFSYYKTGHFLTYGTTALVIPNPSYPTGDLTIYTTSPTLYWYLNESGIGLRYDLQFGTDNLFTPGTYTQTDDITAMNKLISGLTPGETYYWRVRSDNTVNESGWSATAKFSVVGGVANASPVATWPIGAVPPTVYSNTPSLYWYLEGSTLGITGYIVRWKTGSNSTDWSSDYSGSGVIAGSATTNYTFSTALTGGETYYWAVTAVHGSGNSSWSEGSFTVVGGATGGEPNLNYPVDNEIIFTTTPTLSWYFNGTTSGITGYELVYSYSDVFAQGATRTVLTTSTSYTVSVNLIQGATYFWKVRAHYGGNDYSDFSSVETFMVNPGSNTPVQPIVGGPNNVSILTASPQISWVIPSSGQGLTYELEYSDNPFFAGANVINNITTNNHQINGLSNNKSYFWRVRSKNSEGNYSYNSGIGMFKVLDVASSVKEQELLPENFGLNQNYPNPFNPSTTISYQLPVNTHVSLKVFDMLGNEIATLINEVNPAGYHSVTFNAVNFSSGVYFYQLRADDFVSTKKLILMK